MMKASLYYVLSCPQPSFRFSEYFKDTVLRAKRLDDKQIIASFVQIVRANYWAQAGEES